MDRRALLSIRGTTRDRICSLKISKVDEGQQAEVGNVIAELEAEITQIDAALGKLKGKSTSDDNTMNNDLNTQYELNRIVNNIRHQLEGIGNFKPNSQIHVWLDKLSNIYKMIVQPNLANHATLGSEFCSYVVLSLPLSGQNKFSNKTDWDTLKNDLKEHYSADISIFQHLSQVWSLDLSGTKWNLLAAKLGNTLTESKTSIMAKYAKDGKSLDADKVFSLVGAMLMSEAVRSNSPDTYRLMLDSLDQCSSAEEVAKKASFYSDRVSGLESQVFRVNKTTVEPTKKSKPKKGAKSKKEKSPEVKSLIKACIDQKVCIKFNLDQECDEVTCKYKHTKVDRQNFDTFESNVAQVDQLGSDWSNPFQGGN